MICTDGSSLRVRSRGGASSKGPHPASLNPPYKRQVNKTGVFRSSSANARRYHLTNVALQTLLREQEVETYAIG